MSPPINLIDIKIFPLFPSTNLVQIICHFLPKSKLSPKGCKIAPLIKTSCDMMLIIKVCACIVM